MDRPCSTVGSDSAGVIRTEHKNGPERNAVSTQPSDSYGRAAGCCEHRQDPSDFLKDEEHFHLATLNLSSSYSFMIKSRKLIQWIKPLRCFQQLFSSSCVILPCCLAIRFLSILIAFLSETSVNNYQPTLRKTQKSEAGTYTASET
jgi:hypothetical protein